jgi:hypothetical protein
MGDLGTLRPAGKPVQLDSDTTIYHVGMLGRIQSEFKMKVNDPIFYDEFEWELSSSKSGEDISEEWWRVGETG